MTRQVFTAARAALGSLLIAMAACNGRGGGGYMMPAPPAPTASFSQPAAVASIDFGQTLQVAWTSTNATTCSASTSSAAGGTFTGSQSTTGSQTLVPTAPGTYTYMLSCTGVGKDGVMVNGQCTASATPTPTPTFSGPSMASARVIAHGAPLNTPLSAALLKDGDLVVGNADIGIGTPSSTTNLLIEMSPAVPGGFVGEPLQIDSGTPGALFGIAATVDSSGHQIIYFNDDNTAAVMQLGPITAPGGGY